ncbi:quinone oxidoreductase [Heterostelium album PN500]|uniref:Quinone oxidoreductase n=1 Tax=Heterostelium pallidum (strain ATCC 26659 / Pp 5 / PN500) TaxID=670386 RepID=D3BFY9_HETP5|nr:quinone oxidoreductase [Heterostelium album PN500]EFA79749.1 quinone oxidoreductase [Heterostelium album PN500]|eukprot:XP_020431870.1 quinone oxidoreductase [Heterostelium album PN500]
MVMIKKIILKNHVEGRMVQQSDFDVQSVEFNYEAVELAENEIVIKLELVSVDPYIRGRLSAAKSYAASYKVGEPMIGICVGRILKSNNPKWAVGDHCCGELPWMEIFKFNGNRGIYKVNDKLVPLETYLNILGVVGLTAYHGMREIGEPKSGETLVVSAAAGGVGSIVGQIGKIKGCRVVGIAGSDEKCEFLKRELGFDAAVNYNSPTYRKDLRLACPKGVDIYFDNVGGKISEPIFLLLNQFARIPVCGAISMYNSAPGDSVGPHCQVHLVRTSTRMQGFIVTDYSKKNGEAIRELSQWIVQGKLKGKTTITHGFDQIIPSFLSLFSGSNTGKLLVKMDNTNQKSNL